MTDKPTYEALEAQVNALTNEVSNLKQNQGDLYVLNDYLNTLYETTMDLLEKHDLNDLLTAILTRVTGIFKTDTGFLYLLDEDEDNLVLKVSQGHFAKRIGYRLDRGAGLAGKVLQTGEPIVVDDYSVWEGRDPDPYWDPLHSIAGFPIKIQNKTIGVIGIHHIRPEKAMSHHELDSIKRFADLASLGLKNAHLYELLQKELIDRKQAEEALRESETKYRELAENAGLGIYQVTKGGKFLMANQRMANIFGYDSQQDFLGNVDNVIKLYVNPEERPSILKDIDEKGHIEGRELNFKRKDGTPIFCNAYIRLTQTEDGECFYEGLLEDITGRKQTEEALKEAHDHLEMRVEERTAELANVNRNLREQIIQRKYAWDKLKQKEKELKNKTIELRETNTALNVLLKRRQLDKEEVEEKVVSNVKALIQPYLKKLKKTKLTPNQDVYLNILQSNIGDILSPFLRNLAVRYSGLTPKEIEVGNLVKEGKNTKEIAKLMNSTKRAVEFHRHSLREKLGLKNTKANLRSYLISLP